MEDFFIICLLFVATALCLLLMIQDIAEPVPLQPVTTSDSNQHMMDGILMGVGSAY